MVRGAFCGKLSCPPRDRKQHENRDVFLPTERHALLVVVVCRFNILFFN